MVEVRRARARAEKLLRQRRQRRRRRRRETRRDSARGTTVAGRERQAVRRLHRTRELGIADHACVELLAPLRVRVRVLAAGERPAAAARAERRVGGCRVQERRAHGFVPARLRRRDVRLTRAFIAGVLLAQRLVAVRAARIGKLLAHRIRTVIRASSAIRDDVFVRRRKERVAQRGGAEPFSAVGALNVHQFVLVALRLEPRVEPRSHTERADVVVPRVKLDRALARGHKVVVFVVGVVLGGRIRRLVRLIRRVLVLGRLAGDRGAPRPLVVPGDALLLFRVGALLFLFRARVTPGFAHRGHLVPEDTRVEQLVRGTQQVIQVVVRLRRVVRLLREARRVQRAVAGGGVGIERDGPRHGALVRVLRVVPVVASRRFTLRAHETRNQLGFGFRVPRKRGVLALLTPETRAELLVEHVRGDLGRVPGNRAVGVDRARARRALALAKLFSRDCLRIGNGSAASLRVGVRRLRLQRLAHFPGRVPLDGPVRVARALQFRLPRHLRLVPSLRLRLRLRLLLRRREDSPRREVRLVGLDVRARRFFGAQARHQPAGARGGDFLLRHLLFPARRTRFSFEERRDVVVVVGADERFPKLALGQNRLLLLRAVHGPLRPHVTEPRVVVVAAARLARLRLRARLLRRRGGDGRRSLGGNRLFLARRRLVFFAGTRDGRRRRRRRRRFLLAVATGEFPAIRLELFPPFLLRPLCRARRLRRLHRLRVGLPRLQRAVVGGGGRAPRAPRRGAHDAIVVGVVRGRARGGFADRRHLVRGGLARRRRHGRLPRRGRHGGRRVHHVPGHGPVVVVVFLVLVRLRVSFVIRGAVLWRLRRRPLGRPRVGGRRAFGGSTIHRGVPQGCGGEPSRHLVLVRLAVPLLETRGLLVG